MSVDIWLNLIVRGRLPGGVVLSGYYAENLNTAIVKFLPHTISVTRDTPAKIA